MMLEVFRTWYRRYFTDQQAVLLAVFLALGFAVIVLMGKMLTPLLAAIVIAYLLEGAINRLQKLKVPRAVGVTVVFLAFLLGMVFIVLGLIPLLSHQLTEFFSELPGFVNSGHQLLLKLPERYPQFASADQVNEIITALRTAMTDLGQYVLSLSLASIPAIVLVLVYLILVPLLVFFFMKDKDIILAWLLRFLPRERSLLTRMWQEMDSEIGNYVRGKFLHIVIVSTVTYIVFAFMRFEYAALLSVVIGLSVVVPYIGAAVVTIPVAIAGYAQWGWTEDYGWFMAVFALLQALDGNVLVPLLFSEAVHLHPVSIVVAVLVFGDLWGFWGLFFAIPLATLVKVILNIWPKAADFQRNADALDAPPAP